MTRKATLVATITVILHATVVFIHALAHETLKVNMPWPDNAFIVLVIIVTPILAGVLIWTKYRRIGAVILGLSMLGAFVYGTFNHFVAHGIDNISEMPADSWGAVFRLTAILLAIIEGLGSAVVIGAFNILGREKVDA